MGKRLPNPWGLYDTYGNVDEWCWDWHIGSVFPTGLVDPVGPTVDVSGSDRIIRGGSSGQSVNNSFERPLGRVAYRRDNLTGLRLVRNDNSSRVAAPLNPPGQQ